MAERKQVNRYYPPDFDPAKHKSINKYRNSHPLRERAKKLSQGILVIRFEMPYNIWCGGCGNHVGMGVRYNAEKKKVGKYYTTPIYEFKMKCHLCDNYIVMETDPKNFDYTITSGAQRKNQKWDMAENEQVLTEDREAVKKLSRDAMYKLEHGVDDTKKLKKAAPSLGKIAEIQSAKKDDYAQSQALRKKFRVEKKELLAVAASDNALLSKSSLEIDLVPESEEDKKLASLLKFSVPGSYEEKREQKRESIQNRNIFAPSTVSSPNSIEISPRSSSSHSSPSSSSSSKKSSGAQQTLINKVIKMASVFGSSGSKRNSSRSSSGLKASAKEWFGRTTKSLICGTRGSIVKRKRKRSEDDASAVSHELHKRSKLSGNRSGSADGGCGPSASEGSVAREESVFRGKESRDAKFDGLEVDDTEGIQGVRDETVEETKAEYESPEGTSSTPSTQQSLEDGSMEALQYPSSSTSSSPSCCVQTSERTTEKLNVCTRKFSTSNMKASSPSHTQSTHRIRENPRCTANVQSISNGTDNLGPCSHNQIRTSEPIETSAVPKISTCERGSPSLNVVLSEGEVSRTDSLYQSSLSLVSCYSSSSGSEDEQ
ncbi:coiled-coil domain-containing protein 130 [Strongylocentrotus purpuratus]|uniref:Coiled-coil domain-containing protein 130 homolog n=1 Tax=Strongylocentrotus purpuratus TaxID=7668 RepID=A0A7M7RCJ2_STRPU|nr:coiled-coil domain-containing protein 130 [Strongylocentrotus purpuratus]|eukprot:XP_782025.3 PREDICTED: coiled-coil domain-containing protein 130 [Strongylocentrotus purpuratus]